MTTCTRNRFCVSCDLSGPRSMLLRNFASLVANFRSSSILVQNNQTGRLVVLCTLYSFAKRNKSRVRPPRIGLETRVDTQVSGHRKAVSRWRNTAFRSILVTTQAVVLYGRYLLKTSPPGGLIFNKCAHQESNLEPLA